MSDNRTTGTATDRLRALLNERDAEWKQGMAWNVTVINGDWLVVEDIDFGTLSVSTTAYQLTPEQAIAATLGSDRHPYEQRITGDGYDWGEIMCDAYDSLMASACESCTPEQMGRLSDYIRAELGGGTLTAEQVREVIQENITFYEGGDYDAQTIADELNAELGSGMCEVESSHYFDEYGCWSVELSCGHTFDWHDSEPPAHCPDCGAKIAKVVEKCTS